MRRRPRLSPPTKTHICLAAMYPAVRGGVIATILGAVLFAMAPVAAGRAQAERAQWSTLALLKLPLEHNTRTAAGPVGTSVFARYASAMRRYRAAAERGAYDRLAIALIPSDGRKPFEPFTWIAEDGSVMQRSGDGLFVLTSGDPFGNWFSDLHCRVMLWPTLFCDDGTERTMSAPDLATMVFDGVPFYRPYPESE